MLLIIVALLAILLWFRVGYETVDTDDGRFFSLPAIILAIWVIAGAVFGPFFLVFRPAGLFDITVERLIFSILIFLLAAGMLTGKVRFEKNITIEIYMGLFSLICILSMLQVGFAAVAAQFASPWFVFITGYLFPFIVFIFAKNYITREKDVTIILQALFFFGIYLCITAFFEYIDYRQFVFPRYINDPLVSELHLNRARGPFLNAAFNGVGILVGFISGLHLLQKKTGLGKVFYQAALLLFFPAVFFTLTRSVYLGMLITLFIFLTWYKTPFSKWKLISLPLAIILILAIANAPRLLSTERREGGVAQVAEVDIRLALLQQSFFLFAERPLTGVGLAQFIPASTRSYKGPVPASVEEAGTTFQHNHLLGIATELGIPGILLYLIVLILILRRLAQIKEFLPESGLMGNNLRITIIAIWCVYLNNNLFVEPSNNVFINAVPFLFAGVADGLYTRSIESRLRFKSPTRVSQSPMRIMNSHV